MACACARGDRLSETALPYGAPWSSWRKRASSAADEIAFAWAVDELELEPVGVVEEQGVVARRVVVLAWAAFDVRLLVFQPGGALVDQRTAAGREGDVVDAHRVAVIRRGMDIGLAFAQAE